MAEPHKKNDTVLFSCDKELKDEYYAICKKNSVNPHSLLRGFMRRAVKDWKDKTAPENIDPPTEQGLQENKE